MPTTYLISGLPGSGKTTYATGLRAGTDCVQREGAGLVVVRNFETAANA